MLSQPPEFMSFVETLIILMSTPLVESVGVLECDAQAAENGLPWNQQCNSTHLMEASRWCFPRPPHWPLLRRSQTPSMIWVTDRTTFCLFLHCALTCFVHCPSFHVLQWTGRMCTILLCYFMARRIDPFWLSDLYKSLVLL